MSCNPRDIRSSRNKTHNAAQADIEQHCIQYWPMLEGLQPRNERDNLAGSGYSILLYKLRWETMAYGTSLASPVSSPSKAHRAGDEFDTMLTAHGLQTTTL